MTPDEALATLGKTDVSLLDQFMKGRFRAPLRVLDAGCGSGRNLDLFLRSGCEVWIVDPSAEAVARARRHAAALRAPIPRERTRVGVIEDVDLPETAFDVVLSIAVLHFARGPAHWQAMVDAAWRRIAPGGVFFARLASSIGIEEHVTAVGNGRYRLGDGSERYLVNLDQLQNAARTLGAEALEPVKSVNVENLRCMTTWVLRKH